MRGTVWILGHSIGHRHELTLTSCLMDKLTSSLSQIYLLDFRPLSSQISHHDKSYPVPNPKKILYNGHSWQSRWLPRLLDRSPRSPCVYARYPIALRSRHDRVQSCHGRLILKAIGWQVTRRDLQSKRAVEQLRSHGRTRRSNPGCAEYDAAGWVGRGRRDVQSG
jgi:hypothetical protein